MKPQKSANTEMGTVPGNDFVRTPSWPAAGSDETGDAFVMGS
jgi:hypothetical protein